MPIATPKPTRAILRAYQVGFGDCFLLTFEYGGLDERRNVLIDFGSTGIPEEIRAKRSQGEHMLWVAEQIREDCGGKLDVVVATHRHKDHISGFATDGDTNQNGETSGGIIAGLNPGLVVQPWTEDPELNDSNIGAEAVAAAGTSKRKQFTGMLRNMQGFARLIGMEAERLGAIAGDEEDDTVGFIQPISDEAKNQLKFMGDNNVSNRSAVMNLRAMGENGQSKFVSFGSRIDLRQIIPGVTVKVLGPPTLGQHHEIMKQRSRDDNEFWMLHELTSKFWGVQAFTADLVEELNRRGDDSADRLFPRAKVFQNFAPSDTRWFIRQVRGIRSEQLLGLVRILDKAMNNTSVILMFEAGEKKLLFPGDAQIENWEYALSMPEIRKLLKVTSLYKVGHHGSRNATPKSLWNDFKNRTTDANQPKRLKSVNSTMAGKHGTTPATAVPRKTLVDQLEKLSDYHTTEKIGDEASTKIVLEL